LAQRDEFGESCACYEKVQLEPAFSEALNNLAVILNRLGRPRAAEERYKQALLFAPESVDIRLNFAAPLGELGRSQEALDIVRHVLNRCPDMLRAQSLASKLTHDLGPRAPNSFRPFLHQ
jgi:tetratricopeptide (TPR) repeat protein